jgi:hypothetical protein
MIDYNNWTHYLYEIRFKDGFYYSGLSLKKGEDPLTDGYYGSPVANKDKWENTPFEKVVVAYLNCECQSEAYRVETLYQVQTYDLNDPLCLNEHFGGGFSVEACSKGGQTGSRTQIDSQIGIHGLSSEEKSKMHKETWQKLPEDVREKRVEALRENYNNLPPERKRQIGKVISQKTKDYYNSLPDDEKLRRVKVMTDSAIETNSKLWKVTKPDGESVVITNLKQFCRENNLSPPLMCKVSKGERSHHKGFRVKEIQDSSKVESSKGTV